MAQHPRSVRKKRTKRKMWCGFCPASSEEVEIIASSFAGEPTGICLKCAREIVAAEPPEPLKGVTKMNVVRQALVDQIEFWKGEVLTVRNAQAERIAELQAGMREISTFIESTDLRPYVALGHANRMLRIALRLQSRVSKKSNPK